MGILDGKVAIVTGAGSGIGRVAALLFAREGAKVVVTARRKAELDALVAEIGGHGGEVVGLARVIAAEYGPRGIRANALLVGGTDTPMGRVAAPTPEARAFVESLHALKRIAAPEEIAQAALFLGSDASSFVTGAATPVDGGISMNRA